jgi:hypothetical protein
MNKLEKLERLRTLTSNIHEIDVRSICSIVHGKHSLLICNFTMQTKVLFIFHHHVGYQCNMLLSRLICSLYFTFS